MLTRFFFALREAGIPVSITEHLTLLRALEARVADGSVDDFYYLARATMVKDEKHFDRFDRAFAAHFRGIENAFAGLGTEIPAEWLRKMVERHFTEEERAQIAALGGLEELMRTLEERLREQKGRHEGGSKWIGTGGTSPFGHGGFNPERDYRNLDDTVELGTRNIKVALRKLRRFAREGAAEEFDLDGTISSTARNAGLLDLKFVPERHNAVKVLLFLDVGGSMEPHVRVCEELFSAARLPRDLRGRRQHEPLRDHAARGQHRALERRGGGRVDAAHHAALPASRVAQPRARGPLGLHGLDRHRAAAPRGPNVPAHARRPRPRHRRAQGLSRTGAPVSRPISSPRPSGP